MFCKSIVRNHSGFPIFENMQSKVHFFSSNVKITLQERSRIKQFLEWLIKKEKQKLTYLNIIFCSDKELLQLNRDFLSHNYFTDIITFHYAAQGEPLQAELYISVDRVRNNAEELNVSFKSEIHRVLFHGCLHLCGYGDKSSQQIKKMREREDYYLRLYFGK
jgi:rRNA maturation RNase YbeY